MTIARTLLAVLLSATLLAAFPATASAQTDFHIFIGTATHDGQVPPVGTEITAYDGTRAIGTALVQAGGQFALQTSQAHGTIVFRIGLVEAAQTFPNWRSGGRTTGFTLTFTTPADPTLGRQGATGARGPAGPAGPAGPEGPPGPLATPAPPVHEARPDRPDPRALRAQPAPRVPRETPANLDRKVPEASAAWLAPPAPPERTGQTVKMAATAATGWMPPEAVPWPWSP